MVGSAKVRVAGLGEVPEHSSVELCGSGGGVGGSVGGAGGVDLDLVRKGR